MERPAAPFRPEALLAHREWIERTARALVHGDAEAEDVAHQAWLEVLERPPAAAPERPRGWLGAVLRFTALDRMRGERRRRRREEAAARPERVDASPPDVVARAETLDRVVHAVLELEEPYRTTVLLRYFEDLPPRDIAAREGIPVETVRTRLKRAMARLRERLDAGTGGDRRRWCLALLPLLRRPSSTAAAAGASASVAAGALLMSKKVAAAVILALLAGGALLAIRPQPTRPAIPPSPVTVLAPSPGIPAPPAAQIPEALPEPAIAPADPAPPPPPPPPAPVNELRDWVVRGTVRSTDGLPVDGAKVTPVLSPAHVIVHDARFVTIPEDTLAKLRPAISPGTSDERGRFEVRLRLTANAEFPVEVRARGFVALDRQVQVVEKAPDLEWDFVLERATGIEGRVMDTDGRPVVGAGVGSFDAATGGASSTVRTGPDGCFRIPDSPGGECTVFVTPPERPKGRWKRESLSRILRGGDRAVDIVLDFVEDPGIETATVRVRVVDPASGKTVIPRKVDLQPRDGWYLERVREVPRRPAIGEEEVTLQEVCPGAWRVWVEMPDKRAQYLDVDVTPGAGEIRATLEVKRTGNILGALDLAGLSLNPLHQGGVWAELRGNGAFPQFAFMDEETRSGKTDQVTGLGTLHRDGSFRMDRLLDGRYRLEFLGDGVSASGDVDVVPGKTARVQLKARRSAFAIFRIQPPADHCWYRLSVWEDGGIRKQGIQRELRSGTPFEIRREVHPGHLRWRVDWTPAHPAAGWALRDPPETMQDATVEILPGETKSIAVPEIPR